MLASCEREFHAAASKLRDSERASFQSRDLLHLLNNAFLNQAQAEDLSFRAKSLFSAVSWLGSTSGALAFFCYSLLIWLEVSRAASELCRVSIQSIL